MLHWLSSLDPLVSTSSLEEGTLLPPLAFSDEKFFVSAGGTLDTGTLREMWPHESALVSPLSSRYGARDTVAEATRLCAGGLGGSWWVVGVELCLAQKLLISRKWWVQPRGLCLLEHRINSPLLLGHGLTWGSPLLI